MYKLARFYEGKLETNGRQIDESEKTGDEDLNFLVVKEIHHLVVYGII